MATENSMNINSVNSFTLIMSSVEESAALMEKIANRRDLKPYEKATQIIEAQGKCVEPYNPALEEKYKSLMKKVQDEVLENEDEDSENEVDRMAPDIIRGMACGLINEGDEFWRPELLPQARELAELYRLEQEQKKQKAEKQRQEKQAQQNQNSCCNLI